MRRPRDTRRGDSYGWLIVAALSVSVTVSYGVLSYAFAVLLPSMQRELGWSRTAITGAFSLALLIAALAGLAVGPVLDRRSPRMLMSIGAGAAAALVAAWSQVESLAQLYLVFAGLGLAMATVLYEPVFTVVTKWFAERRREALTVLTLVAATSSLIFSPLTERLDAALGWRDALLVLAAVLGAIAVPLHALVLRRSPDASAGRGAEPSASARRALRSTPFWLLTGAFTLAAFSTSAIIVHLISLLLHGGHDASFAAVVAGLLGIAQLPGRLTFALAGRRLGDAALAFSVFALGAAALSLLAGDRAGWSAVVFAVAFGASNGMATLLRATLVADLYGRQSYGAVSSVMAAAANIARAAAPVTASLLLLLPGGYTTLLWLLAAGTALAAFGAAFAVARARAAELPEAGAAQAASAGRALRARSSR